jgi:23S rRNA (uracil1939-C5)-methyltransferase
MGSFSPKMSSKIVQSRDQMAKKPKIVHVEILQFSKEGLGRGQAILSDGSMQWVDVPFAVPGDEVKAALLKKKQGVYSSRVIEWSRLSDRRVAPMCIHFGSCGGCKWQNIAYEQQLTLKEARVYELIKPYLQKSTECHPIIPCSPPWHYRNKLELTFSSDRKGQNYLGFILQGTRGHVFRLRECHLASPWMAAAAHAVSQWWESSSIRAYHAGSDEGSLRTLTLREGFSSGDRLVMLTVSGNTAYSLKKKDLEGFTLSLKKAVASTIPIGGNLSIFLRIQQIAKGKKTQFYEILLDGPDHIRETVNLNTGHFAHAFHFQISPSAFFQPNTRQAEMLYSSVVRMMNLPRDSVIYDLYCGTGTLGICLAKNAKEVIGIDICPESVCDARENVKKNLLSNVSIIQGDVGQVLCELQAGNERVPDAVLVDPPRVGLDFKAIKHILELKAPILAYVSCNPVTQAENLKSLTQERYELVSVQPIDQFPHTAHVENIVIMKRC